jgi:hypothetical protein
MSKQGQRTFDIYTNHRVICLVVIGSSFYSEQVFQVSNGYRPSSIITQLYIECVRLTVTSIISSTFRRKKVELSSSLRRYPFETRNTCSLSKEEPITTRQMTL